MSELSSRLAALTAEQRALLSARLGAAPPRPGLVPIAVIGVGCRFPGGANSPEAFWQRLCAGYDAVRTAPADRWDAERYYSADPGAVGKTNSRWGGFLDQVDQFDREFFGLAPREVVHMDPQQRLLLETAWEALEDAGQMIDRLAGSAAGVFVGAQSHSADYYSLQARDRQRLDTYTATGTAHSILANRLSFLLDLRGPSLTVDTACSSSLVAVHLACQSLRVTDCDLAIAAGINLMLTPDFHICLGKLEMMSPDGRCKTFDHRANGFVRGEGCGVAILKRLPDALRDRDPLLAVILGSAVNQDGASNGLTAPSGPAQQAVLRRALEVAQVAPEKVGYVETHGTGTALGDPIEVEALAAVLASGGLAARSCFLGALKTNLGHLEAASGIAGLIKAVLCLEQGSIPPNLHFERLNPHLSLSGTPFVLPTELQPWPRTEERRIAGVSSFGFGGTNAHVVLSDWSASDEPPDAQVNHPVPARLLPISARSGPALCELAASYVEFLAADDGTKLSPADVAYSASLRRLHHDHRLCVVGRDAAEWAAALVSRLREGVADSKVIGSAAAKIVFVYSGQGSQWPTMGCRLMETEPVFREALLCCDAALRQHVPWSIVDELSAPASSSRLGQTEIAQPALFALQMALTELWKSWGIEPAAVIGHSVGEVAAAYAAGVLSLADAAQVVVHRGRLMQGATGRGRMAAFGLTPAQAGQMIECCRERVSIAAINSPCSVVLSGDAELLEGLVRQQAHHGVFARLLDVDYAFHSPQMDAFAAELTRSLEGLQTKNPQTQIVSTVSARMAGPGDFGPAYWARNIRQPVLFADAVKVLLAAGQQVFVEIGPHPVLCPPIAQCETPASGPLTTVASLRRDGDAQRTMLDALAKLHEAGCDIRWRQFFPGNERCVKLPRYPWQRQRYWLPPTTDEDSAQEAEPPADWFYELEWQAQNSLNRVARHSSALENVDLDSVATRLGERVRQLERDGRSDDPEGLQSLLDDLSAEYIWEALATLGAQVSVGSRWPKTGLDRVLKVRPGYGRLMVRLLGILAAAGVLRDEGQHWIVLRPLSTGAASRASERLVERFATAREVLQLHDRCGSRLAEVLAGRCDPLSLLFSGDNKSSAEAIYRDAAPSRLGNRVAAEAVRDWVAQLPANRTLRVLEIGAGTGGTTAALLPQLPQDRCEYVFTDLSRLFLQRAAENFAGYAFVRYELFDLERPPAEQGFAAGQFDLIVAANVVHATRDVAISLDHAKSLLAPGGVLLLIEATAPRPWMDITFGLTEGWWRFADHGLRDAHPLMTEQMWVGALGERGFTGAMVLPLQRPGTALFDQALILARRSPLVEITSESVRELTPQRHLSAKYLVLADSQGLADELKRQLEARGDICYLVRAGHAFEQRSEGEFSAAFDCAEDLRRICEQLGSACKAVVYLAGLDREQPQPRELVAAAQHPLLLVQALLADRLSPAGGLWLVTRGGQAVANAAAPSGPAQSVLWGLGRGIGLEEPDLGTRLVDLDPFEALDRSAAALLAELDDPGPEDQIALRHQQRYVCRLKRSTSLSARIGRLRTVGTHLITGGLGGLGAQLALRLAKVGASHLVLVVKRPLPERRQWDTLAAESADAARVAVVRQLESLGVKVTTAAVDLADESALADWFTSLDFSDHPLRGIWHTAMSFSSASLGELSPEAVRTMIDVKAAAAWRLHELSRAHELDYFVLFSSTTALWGATGLAHYAAANAFLDALAHFRRADGRPATAVNWGTWQQMQGLSTVERDRAARAGLRPMPASAALAALERVLAATICQAVVADVDWSIFKPIYESRRRRPLLERFANEPAENDPAEKNGRAHPLADQWFSAPADERRELVAQHVHRLLSAVLGTATQGFIDRRKGFFELGMDSLTSVQLRRRLETDLCRPLPSTLTFNYPTIDLLTDYLTGELFTAEAPTEAPRAPAEPAAVDPGEDDDNATEEELFEQLAARLVQRRT